MSIQIVVTHTTHQITYYDVPPEQGWKVNPAMRCLVVGKGVPRTYVPLDTVLTFAIEECPQPRPPLTSDDPWATPGPPAEPLTRCNRGETGCYADGDHTICPEPPF